MVVIPVGIAFFNEAMTTVAGWMFFNLRKVTTKLQRPIVRILPITFFVDLKPRRRTLSGRFV